MCDSMQTSEYYAHDMVVSEGLFGHGARMRWRNSAPRQRVWVGMDGGLHQPPFRDCRRISQTGLMK